MNAKCILVFTEHASMESTTMHAIVTQITEAKIVQLNSPAVNLCLVRMKVLAFPSWKTKLNTSSTARAKTASSETPVRLSAR